MRGLSPVEAAVVRVLADEHGHYGGYGDMKITEIMYRTRYKESAVKKALRSLERDDGVVTDRPKNQGCGQITRYHLLKGSSFTW